MNINTVILSPSADHAKTAEVTDYRNLLDKGGIAYRETGGFLVVGEIMPELGWVIHLSVIKTQVCSLVKTVAAFLFDEGIVFKIPCTIQCAENILSGAMGYGLLGQVVSIYPKTDDQALKIARGLIKLTGQFDGPAIPMDMHLGACVYTRFGDAGGSPAINDYAMPFRLPEGVAWPFIEIVAPIPIKNPRKINKRYLQVHTLKKDIKGDVIKALDLGSWRHIRWCLIKQGKRNMVSDDYGRTITERLLWQKEMQEHLEGTFHVPRIYDFFVWRGDSYLVMEYVEGTLINELIQHVFRGRAWADLPVTDRVTLLEALLKVIRVVEVLHQNQVIHRDIMPNNFLLDKNGQVVCIDLELSHHCGFSDQPVFTLGTHGYMSPEQAMAAAPDINQDIFSVGALMIIFFTSMSPLNFSGDTKKLTGDLFFFIEDEAVATVIAACLNADPRKRPALKEIITTITKYLERRKDGHPDKSAPDGKTESDNGVLINEALFSLASHKFRDTAGCWLSKAEQDTTVQNENISLCSSAGLYSGIAGVLYCIAKAHIAGYDTDPVRPAFNTNLNFIRETVTANQSVLNPGLYEGAAGISKCLLSCHEAGLANKSVIAYAKQLLFMHNEKTDVATGMAGQGIACLAYERLYQDKEISEYSKTLAEKLIEKQLKDGSWLFSEDESGKKPVKVYGFSYGVAGVTYFLLDYVQRHGNGRILLNALKSLDWLEKHTTRKAGQTRWALNPKNKISFPWFEGYSGICLSFIKAYEVTKLKKYKAIAEAVLSNHPKHMVSTYRDLSDGITGIGEIYLEAGRVFRDKQWYDRAEYIADMLQHTYLKDNNDTYWLTDNSNVPTAELMKGSAGIIHFLIGCQAPEKTGFPLIS